jgi:hypothetical protein
MEHDPTLTPRRRFRRAGARGAAGPGGGDPLAALEAELVLLREENGRLKAAQHRGPGLDRALDLARALPAAVPAAGEADDEGAQMLVEGLVLRESLLELCQEVERAMVVVEARLKGLGPAGGQGDGGAGGD